MFFVKLQVSRHSVSTSAVYVYVNINQYMYIYCIYNTLDFAHVVYKKNIYFY